MIYTQRANPGFQTTYCKLDDLIKFIISGFLLTCQHHDGEILSIHWIHSVYQFFTFTSVIVELYCNQTVCNIVVRCTKLNTQANYNNVLFCDYMNIYTMSILSLGVQLLSGLMSYTFLSPVDVEGQCSFTIDVLSDIS